MIVSEENNETFSRELNKDAWKIVGLVILCVRFVQGFIFWAGGSRRFIYDPQKLDPHATTWLANKLQSAMPGALLGLGSVISYLLQHFFFLYSALILFSLVELISGAALLLGFFTRLAATMTVLLSITLMLIFGWQGSTCLDEWTMAVSNLAMGFTLVLSGASIYSIDSWLIHRHPEWQQKRWFINLASGSWQFNKLKNIAIIFLIFSILFTTLTYNYYRGAIFSRYHPGPVSPTVFHLTLSKAKIVADGLISFNLAVDAGSTAAPAYIVRIELVNTVGKIIEAWEGKQLSLLPNNNIVNEYQYNRITTGPYGLIAPVSARARIFLMPNRKIYLSRGQYEFRVFTIDGKRYNLLGTIN